MGGEGEEELRERAAEILGADFAFPPSADGNLNFLYDFYLKFKRAGFTEKQSLYLCANLMMGGHDPQYWNDGSENGKEASGS